MFAIPSKVLEMFCLLKPHVNNGLFSQRSTIFPKQFVIVNYVNILTVQLFEEHKQLFVQDQSLVDVIAYHY